MALIRIRSVDLCSLENVYLESSYGRRSFTYSAPRYWNALPLNIRSANNIDIFKRLTKYHLFNNFAALKRAAFMYH